MRNHHKSEFLYQMQRRVAHIAIGASTARGPGPGVVKRARDWLTDELDLCNFFEQEYTKYPDTLDNATERLLNALPMSSKKWELSRKFLNIFIRDTLYNKYLNSLYKIEQFENMMEIPLDKYTATAIKNRDTDNCIPDWTNFKDLTKENIDLYQAAATKIALKYGWARVHLDLLFWREEQN